MMNTSAATISTGWFAGLKIIYRKEWSAIPVSVVSTVLTTLIMCYLLTPAPVKSFIAELGELAGAALCIFIYNVLWYVLYRYLVEPVSLFGGRGERVKADGRASSSCTSGDRQSRRKRNLFLAYFVGFNTVQFLAAAEMLFLGVSPATAQAWNSAVGNIVWLGALPFVRHLIVKWCGEES